MGPSPDPQSDRLIENYRRRFFQITASGRNGNPRSEAEERLFLLSSASADAIWDCNLEAQTVWWNDAYERMFGRRAPDDTASDWWIERIHPDDRVNTVIGLEQALAGPASHWFAEYRFRRENGAYATVRDRTFIARSADGTARRLTSAKTDLTEQRRVEAELRNTHSILQSFYESVPICMGVVEVLNHDFEMVHANAATCQALRIDPKEFRGLRLGMNGLPADIREEWFNRYQQAHQTRQPVRFEYFSPATNRWFSATVSEATPGESGRPRAVFTAEDITPYKRSLEERREAEERFRRLYESNIIGIVSGDEDRVLDANDVFLQMLGYSRDELNEGQLRWHDLTAPEYRHLGPETVADVKTLGSYGPFEKEYLRKDGSRISVLIGCIRLQNTPYRDLCFVLDLTERKLLERRVLEAQKFESLGVLAGGIAHDFNNLLVGILGHTSLAQDLLPQGHPGRELLAQVIRSGEQAAHLTRQMLAYSGKGRFLLEPLDLSAVFEEISILVRPAISREITLDMALPEGLPGVEADRGQMRQVFTNLVLNAAEAIPPTGGHIRVETGVRRIETLKSGGDWVLGDLRPGRYVYLEVADTGCGMDEITKAKMFDPFYTTKFVGRGLGLAAVAGIVRGHKGAMSVTSAPGQGSRFVVLFPISSQFADAASDVSPQQSQPEVRKSVLLVDDEGVVRNMARAALERHGYRVTLAESGLEAIEVFNRNPADFSIVVLDLSMPGLSGAETLPELLRACPQIPVLITSGYPEAETLRLFAGQKVAGFLQKPFTSQILVSSVDSALSELRGQATQPRNSNAP